MIKMFIDRPVLSTVISIFIVVFGILGITQLPITQYPDIAPPTVSISTSYPGANAQTVLESVVIPIEEQVNGVEDMNYISSSASNNGSASISVVFKQGVDPDIATVNVQNRVARATPILPSEVTRSGVVTQKRNNSALMYLSIYSANPEYDDVFIQNYLNINVIPGLKRISGVGDASVFGGKDYAMRIWISPEKMASYNLSPTEVARAMNSQSRQATPGQLGQNSGESFEYVINYKGKFNEQEQYENIVLRTGDNGQILRLGDVADIELSGFSYASSGEANGHPAISLGIFQTPGSNAQVIIEEVKEYLDEADKNFPKGMGYTINYDTNDFLTASINSVIFTLIEAFLLVGIVVFVFLQDLRSTLIPAIAVPVSIIGTFFFLYIFGYSINLLTLFALILAIGIVVDDAIVVIEAVHAKMEKEKPGADMKKVTKRAMDGITVAIISITLVMAAVFVPVTFISGPSGVFFQQFGLTLVVAILISALNALTLSPMLCALLLKPHESKEKQNIVDRLHTSFNTGFKAMTNKYGRVSAFFIKNKWLAILVLIGAGAGIYFSDSNIPKGFVPNEDRKMIFASIELPVSATLDRTMKTMQELQKEIIKIDGVENLSYSTGRSLLGGSGGNYAMAFIRLDDWDVRDGKDGQTVEAIQGKLFGLNSQFPDARLIFFGPPSVRGYGAGSGFDFQMLDRLGGSFKDLNQVTQDFIADLTSDPRVLYAQTSFNTNYPQYQLDVDMDLAAVKNVDISEIFSTLSGYVGGMYASDFVKYGKFFRVVIQAKPEERKDVNSLDKIYVKNNSGEMIPITQFVSLERVYGPQSVTRFNLYNAASVTGAPSEGFSTGEAIQAIIEKAENLPPGYGIDFSGLTREEVKSGSQTIYIYILVILFVFLLLAAQYESFLLPFSILLPLPIGVFGAYLFQYSLGLENNIYFQIALIMIMGLLAKNAILIVEFALQERRRGESIIQSAILGAEERLRPILMTSFAFIIGLMPLVLSSGVGAVGNRSLATGAAFGMLIGTLGGLLVIPVFYVIFQTIQEKIRPVKFDTHEE